MTPDYARLRRSGDWEQIHEWFQETHGVEVTFHVHAFCENGLNSWWEGLVYLYGDEYCTDTEKLYTAIFSDTGVEVRFRNSIQPLRMVETQYIWRFVMVATEWPSLLMMQELSGD